VTIADGYFKRYSDVDFYDLFHVTKDADPQLIQLGYRLAALRAHPDTGGNPRLMQLLNKAKETLLDPKLRAEYDELLTQRRGPQPDLRASADQQLRVVELEREISDRDSRLAGSERQVQELKRTCARLEGIEREHRVVVGRVHEVSAALASVRSTAAISLVNAVDSLLAPIGSSVDSLESFREVLVIADQPRPHDSRRLVAGALVIGLVAGGVAAAILATVVSLSGW
jgi:hypothetical protein